MDVVFSVCIVTRGAVGARVWEVWLFCHAYVVCLCLACIMWHAPGDHMEEAYSRAGLMTAL